MSPVSCLVGMPSTERRKKRVRFRDEVVRAPDSSDCAMLADNTSDDLTAPPCVATLPQTSANAVQGSLTSQGSSTSHASEPVSWGVSSQLPNVWKLPNLPTTCAAQAVATDGNATCPEWWSHKVSAMGVSAPLTVLPSVPCQDAVDIMLRERFDQLPVVDQPGEVLGVVTLRSLMTSLVVQRALPSTSVGEVMCSQFCTLSRDHTLQNLTSILQHNHFAFIVHNQRRLTEKRQVATKAVVIGIVTPVDLLAYIMEHGMSV